MRRLSVVIALSLLLGACSSKAGEIAALGLEGRMIYTQGPDGLWEIDLDSGKSMQLWEMDEGAFVSGVAVSPDGLDLVLAYAPPTDSPIPRADIYLANADGSDPQPLLQHRTLHEAFNSPTWSPNGQWVYFTRSDVLIDDEQGTSEPVVNIERVPAGGGAPELVVKDAEQPNFSADGSRLAYLRFDLETFTRSLWVANADGSEAMEVLPDSMFTDLASPRLSPDGETIVFAGSGIRSVGAAAPRSLWDRLLGIQSAYAHGLPWDFYSMPAKGGELDKITDWATDGPAAAWSPLGDHLALMHIGGLFVTGGEEPSRLAETPSHGGIDWAQ